MLRGWAIACAAFALSCDGYESMALYPPEVRFFIRDGGIPIIALLPEPPPPVEPPVEVPTPLLEFLIEDCNFSAGRFLNWPSTSGPSWINDTSQVYYTKPIQQVAAKSGYDCPRFTGEGVEKTKVKLDLDPLSTEATSWTFAAVYYADREFAIPDTRGYLWSVENFGTSGADDSTKWVVAAESNQPGFWHVGFAAQSSPGTSGSGWHLYQEVNFDGGLNYVSVRQGWQVMVWTIDTAGCYVMRNGVVIGRLAPGVMSTLKKAFGEINLGSEYNADASDQTYHRGMYGDHSVWNQTLTEAQALAWSLEKMAKFDIHVWPPAGETLPTWATVWYTSHDSSTFVRDEGRRVTKWANFNNLATHVATSGAPGTEPALDPHTSSEQQGLTFDVNDALAAHSVAGLIDANADFGIVAIVKADHASSNTDGRVIRAINSGGGSAEILLSNAGNNPPTVKRTARRHDGTTNVQAFGGVSGLLTHTIGIDRQGSTFRMYVDGKFSTITQASAAITIDQLFIGGGQTVQTIASVAIIANRVPTQLEYNFEHQRAINWYGAEFNTLLDFPWQYGCSAWFEGTPSFHEDTGAAGTCDALYDLTGSNLSIFQGTNANNPTIVTGAGAYLDFDGTNDDLVSGYSISSIITATAWEAYVVLKVDAVNTANANFDANDVVIGDNGYWGIALKSMGAGLYQVQVGQYDGAYKHATVAITLNAWHVIHAYFDGTNINVELNGVPEPPAASGAVQSVAGTFKVGGSDINTTQQFDGKIRGIAIFPATLSIAGRNAMAARFEALRALA
jgi:Concanavalin A-like lectin/glucanases superfamily